MCSNELFYISHEYYVGLGQLLRDLKAVTIADLSWPDMRINHPIL